MLRERYSGLDDFTASSLGVLAWPLLPMWTFALMRSDLGSFAGEITAERGEAAEKGPVVSLLRLLGLYVPSGRGLEGAVFDRTGLVCK